MLAILVSVNRDMRRLETLLRIGTWWHFSGLLFLLALTASVGPSQPQARSQAVDGAVVAVISLFFLLLFI